MKVKHIFFFFELLACGSMKNTFYQGMVLDENNNPIENVTVFEEYNIEKTTKTNDKGYFKLYRNSDRLGKLVFIKDGYKIDTIPTIWTQHGEQMEYNFIGKETTSVRLRKGKSKMMN